MPREKMREIEKPKRNRNFLVQLTEEENRALVIAANIKGVTKSGYFRTYLMPTVRRDANGEL